MIAGAAGVDPDPRTLRELLAMSEGSDRARWAHTSAVLCLLWNVNRDPKKGGPKRPAQFNPYECGKVKKITIGELKDRMMR